MSILALSEFRRLSKTYLILAQTAEQYVKMGRSEEEAAVHERALDLCMQIADLYAGAAHSLEQRVEAYARQMEDAR